MEFKALKKSGIFNLLSTFGKEISQPPGIVEWSERAKKEAAINSTVGVATGKPSEYMDSSSDKVGIFHLSAIKELYNNFKPEQIFAYAPVLGIPSVRNSWKKWIGFKLKDHNPAIESIITQPYAIPGITVGIYVLCRMFLSPTEKAILPEKRWGNYDAIIKRNIGAGIQSFTLFRENRFNYEGLKSAIVETAKNQDKAFVLLNFPNNPTGYSPDR
ncbi:MAG: aminotransferase class I/II-fold pyridoxal phosphate-dependent enzyme, partial [Nitrospinota bacterium]|nr:aminotransferase class I/II-fold pyridoxal phosphate-dependent enzyme [Nitrospinota bacterium]